MNWWKWWQMMWGEPTVTADPRGVEDADDIEARRITDALFAMDKEEAGRALWMARMRSKVQPEP